MFVLFFLIVGVCCFLSPSDLGASPISFWCRSRQPGIDLSAPRKIIRAAALTIVDPRVWPVRSCPLWVHHLRRDPKEPTGILSGWPPAPLRSCFLRQWRGSPVFARWRRREWHHGRWRWVDRAQHIAVSPTMAAVFFFFGKSFWASPPSYQRRMSASLSPKDSLGPEPLRGSSSAAAVSAVLDPKRRARPIARRGRKAGAGPCRGMTCLYTPSAWV